MKGVCFKEPLFIKTIELAKTQTRRLIPNCDSLRESVFVKSGYETWHGRELKPKYNIGETIYLKEPYRVAPDIDSIIYKFDYPNGRYEYPGCDKVDIPVEWKNKLFMPEKYARHFINIKAVRAEKLQDISNEDCIKEGIFQHISHAKVYWKNGSDQLMYDSPRDAYAALIDRINGKGTWESNPYVWVYDYELTDKPTPTL